MISLLARAAFAGYQRLKAADPRRARQDASWAAAHPARWPYPPPRFRMEVAGTTDLAWFEEGGRRAEQSIREILELAGLSRESFRHVLDFGCGCGRVTRHLAGGWSARLYGCDINAANIAWCRSNLPFADFRTSPLAPPLPYEQATFDLIYAFSVMTHLTAQLQRAWMDEFVRIMQPGGYLALSVHGEKSAEKLDGSSRQAFLSGEMVVRFEGAAGSNLCNAYHPRSWVERVLAPPWTIAAFVPEGALGNPYQDLYLLRRPS